MATSPESSRRPVPPRSWSALVAQARTAPPPPVDVTLAVRAYLATARPPPAAPPLWEEFARLFAVPRLLLGCAAATALVATLSVWQAQAALTRVDPYVRLLLCGELPAWARALLS